MVVSFGPAIYVENLSGGRHIRQHYKLCDEATKTGLSADVDFTVTDSLT